MPLTSSKRLRIRAAIGSVLFLVVAPGTVAGVAPWWLSRWTFHQPFAGYAVIRLIGALLAASGLIVLLDSFFRFAIDGLGTPAPVMPTKHLIVQGYYRYVRNPMYVAVLALIIGQGLWFGSVPLLAYAAAAGIVTHLFVTLYEEPTLRRSFPQEYPAYCAKVPRWLPKLR